MCKRSEAIRDVVDLQIPFSFSFGIPKNKSGFITETLLIYLQSFSLSLSFFHSFFVFFPLSIFLSFLPIFLSFSLFFLYFYLPFFLPFCLYLDILFNRAHERVGIREGTIHTKRIFFSDSKEDLVLPTVD